MTFESNKKDISLATTLRNLEYDLKQNLITSGPPPTLKHILLTNIVTPLWHKQLKYADFELLKYSLAWQILEFHERELKNNVAAFEIPVDCKDSLNDIIYFVGEEITGYVQSYYDFYHRATIDKLKVFLDNICWTQQGTINFLKTSMQVIEKSDLSIRDKYEIACCCCLEEKIQELLNILPQDVIKEIEDDGITRFSLPSFWTTYIRNKELPTLIKGDPAGEFLVKYAISNHYAVALPYIWEKFANKAVNDNFMEYAELAGVNNINAVIYFAKHMTQLQLEEASPKVHCGLLNKLHAISIYYNVLPTSHYMLELIRTKDVYHNYEVITFCWVRSYMKDKEFINIWKEFVLHFESDLEGNTVNIYESYSCNYFGSARGCIIVTKLLLEMTAPENRNELIYANNTFEYCVGLIICFGLKEFNFFIYGIFKSEEISNFKKEFFKDKGYALYLNLITKNKYEVIDEVLLEFGVEERLKGFKRYFFYDNLQIFYEIVENFVDKDIEFDLSLEWTKYIRWCYDEDEKEILICRINVFDIDSDLCSDFRVIYFDLMYDLIIERKWNFVEQSWKWFFYSAKKILSSSKEKLERINKILFISSGELNFLDYMKNTEYHKLLKRFIVSCFKQNEIIELKEELGRSDDLSLIVIELLKLNKLLEANNFISWCYSSDKNKIADFKTTFMKLYGSSLMFELFRCGINP